MELHLHLVWTVRVESVRITVHAVRFEFNRNLAECLPNFESHFFMS